MLGMNQMEFAVKLCVPVDKIRNLENPNRSGNMTRDLAIRCGLVFGAKPSSLVGNNKLILALNGEEYTHSFYDIWRLRVLPNLEKKVETIVSDGFDRSIRRCATAQERIQLCFNLIDIMADYTTSDDIWCIFSTTKNTKGHEYD